MRFQTKIIAGYAVFIFTLALIIGFAYHRYSLERYEQMEETNMRLVADQLKSQMEERISRMELATEYILSDPYILDSIRILGSASKEQGRPYIEEAKSMIREGISTYYITDNFYRTIWFNQAGDMFAAYNNPLARKTKTAVDFEKMPYLEQTIGNTGKPILINAHEDPWGLYENPQVFSLLKVIQGKNMGYIEVQYQIIDLVEFQIPRETLSYMVLINDKELLYSSDSGISPDDFYQILDSQESDSQRISMPDQTVLATKAISGEYPLTILVFEDMDSINAGSSYIKVMTFVIALIFFLISMMFVVLLSQILTKPLRQLRAVMEHTELENLGEDIKLETSNDEIQALSVSYQELMIRLDESIQKEQQLSMLQLQAQFDLLQAQVNPHFIYNVLNIISARGMTNDDDLICEICGSLASMLRYATSNKTRYATVGEELEYLEQYFYLLKCRYQDKIEFRINVEAGIRSERIPKVALQQIVENCINHGFEHSVNQMKVTLTGWKSDGYWYVKVHDNGQGFHLEVLTELKAKMEMIRQKVLKERNNMELEIGGMGLINTFTRCLLLYNGEMTFSIENFSDGAVVILGARCEKE